MSVLFTIVMVVLSTVYDRAVNGKPGQKSTTGLTGASRKSQQAATE